jgi:hypothetical protein
MIYPTITKVKDVASGIKEQRLPLAIANSFCRLVFCKLGSQFSTRERDDLAVCKSTASTKLLQRLALKIYSDGNALHATIIARIGTNTMQEDEANSIRDLLRLQPMSVKAIKSASKKARKKVRPDRKFNSPQKTGGRASKRRSR